MRKYKEWPKGQSLTDWLGTGDEVDEELYYYFLEVLPPAVMLHGCFAVGEPLRHRGPDEAVFMCFGKSGVTDTKTGKETITYMYMGELTIKELAEKVGVGYHKKEV